MLCSDLIPQDLIQFPASILKQLFCFFLLLCLQSGWEEAREIIVSKHHSMGSTKNSPLSILVLLPSHSAHLLAHPCSSQCQLCSTKPHFALLLSFAVLGLLG